MLLANEDVDPYSNQTEAHFNYDAEWSTQFHGVSYIVNVRVEGSLLSIDAEHLETNQRWSGEYTAQYIEEITLKAGNYKKFTVFTRMLRSALNKESDSLFVDLLAYADLEALKAKKLGNVSSQSGASVSTSMHPSRTQLKRYVILTYTGEYDRVHFPLPLSFEESPNPDALRRTIRRLRAQIDKPKEDLSRSLLDGNIDQELRGVIAQLRLENTELKHKVRLLQSRTSRTAESPSRDGMETRLRRELDAVKRQLSEVSAAYVGLKRQSRIRDGYGEREHRSIRSHVYDPVYAQSRRPVAEGRPSRFIPDAYSGRDASGRPRRPASDDEAFGSRSSRRREPASHRSSPRREFTTSPQRNGPPNRFDPTAYQQQRRDAIARGVASRSPQRSVSGYSSASSQSSKGSRRSEIRASPSSDDRRSRVRPVVASSPMDRPSIPKHRPSQQASPQMGVSYQEMKRQAKVLAEPRRDEDRPRPVRTHTSDETKGNLTTNRSALGETASITSKDKPVMELSRSVESRRSNDSSRSGRERHEEISDIDKRILALRSYLDHARSSILDEK